MNEIKIDDRTSLILVAAPETETALTDWQVAPENRERYDRWLKCQFDWLNALMRKSGGSNTRRAYERDVVDFFATFRNYRLMPWDVTGVHAETWVQHLRTRGLADSSINRKIAALSSLYRYASTECVYIAADGSRSALWPWPNPFGARSLRTAISPYGHASYPSSVQVVNLLAAIDVRTVTGLRNMALLAGLFGTTRRVSEWINLRACDIHDDANGGHWFEYRYKGGKAKRQTIPADIWRTITAYLRADGRPWPLAGGQYIFRSTSAAGSRIRNADGTDHIRPNYDPANQPISASYVNQLIQRYGLQAGIPETKLHAHALRHAGARWRKDQGADVWALKDTLGHASIAITQVYTETALDEPEDALGDTIGAVLPKQLKLLFK